MLFFVSVAMGRCQSTPGLVETKGRISIEEMWLCHSAAQAPVSYNQQSLIRYLYAMESMPNIFFAFSTLLLLLLFCSRAPSPRSTRGDHIVNERHSKIVDSPGSISPSVHSSDERPRSRTGSHPSRPQSQPSRTGSYLSYTFTSTHTVQFLFFVFDFAHFILTLMC